MLRPHSGPRTPAGRHALFANILSFVVYALFPLVARLLGGFDVHGWLG